jgi:3'-phosphoadenosine 5'-phosphosulfate sulfotransferase (PAPS reductase)/FAD synthetase
MALFPHIPETPPVPEQRQSAARPVATGDPFLIDGPAVISFSGGRTSGYMLRRILDAGLQEDCHVLFANTGKERPETLAFVRECAARWGVTIHWLEYQRGEIDPQAASTNGEPFEALITARRLLPNPVTRFCTSELKIRPMKEWMKARGYKQWWNVVGIRADEPRRVARMLAPNRERWENVVPLATAGVTLADVSAFWAAQPFDLRLKPYQGNCDLCFLKGRAKKLAIIRDDPSAADWWAQQEERMGARFRSNGPTYADMQKSVMRSPLLFGAPPDPPEEEIDDFGDCVCHD